MERPDIIILGSQLVTVGTRITLAWNFTEREGQAFTIASGILDLFQDDGTATTIVNRPLTVTTVNGRQRAAVTLQTTDTENLDAGAYFARMALTLGDGQTRIGRASIRIREATF